MPVPEKFGGPGLSLAEMCREQRRLAYHAPATALAVNMHLYWVGVAADLWRRGDDTSLEWMLRDAAAGEIFAAGHAESGNDIPVLALHGESGTRGGRLPLHRAQTVWQPDAGLDAFRPPRNGHKRSRHPKIVHAFMPRDSAGYIIKETWDVLGMRATRSDDTVLENAFIPDRYVARVVPAGGAGIDAFVLSVFAWALMGFANVYYGLARRALDKSIAAAKSKNSLALSRSMAYHPEVQHAIAQMVIELESIGPHLDRIAEDWSNGVDHGAEWPSKIFAAKYRAVEAILAGGRSRPRCCRRPWHLSLGRIRALAARCAPRQDSSRQCFSYARSGRQDRARYQPR
jgi:alkylation response protein AidB-like acyl-CoA dehydrogenase